MREKITTERLKEFMRRLALGSKGPGKVYFTGGSTALLLGIRDQTIDIDIKLDPEPAGAFEAIDRLKEELNINVELASPDNFIPAPSKWREFSRYIDQYNGIEFYHYDLACQALAKIERGFSQDLSDVRELIIRKLISTDEIVNRFQEIKVNLIRYPSIEPTQFEKKVFDFIADFGKHD